MKNTSSRRSKQASRFFSKFQTYFCVILNADGVISTKSLAFYMVPSIPGLRKNKLSDLLAVQIHGNLAY